MPRRQVGNPSAGPVAAALNLPDWATDRSARDPEWTRVAGVDEAGRGPLAGPVVAAAVILPEQALIPGLRDSKLLIPEQREEVYVLLLGCAAAWAVGVADVEEIDRINILRATHLAMARALAGLAPPADGALVDGLPVQGLPCAHRALVDGDARCVTIAAASVIAKVTRDRMMADLDERYPGYGFSRHKGYSTPEHLEALRRLGPCPIHRRSFRPVYEGALALSLDFTAGGEAEGAGV